MLALYHGLIRRRVADTLGEALLMGAMMVAGLWVIADPTGTVGALGQWADQASLGTLAVAAQGTPAAPGRALGDSLGSLFTAAIEAPWCYLEFGDVGWCREASRLDPSLRAAASRIETPHGSTAGTVRMFTGPLRPWCSPGPSLVSSLAISGQQSAELQPARPVAAHSSRSSFGVQNAMHELCEEQPPSTFARAWRMKLLPFSWGSIR